MTSVRRRLAGFTLVEMIVTIIVLAIALVSVSAMLRGGVSESADTLLDTRAIALGHAYLDEILGRRFDERSAPSGLDPCYGLAGAGRCSDEATEFGPDGGETRGRFDDVDDYHGLEEGDGEATPLADAEGEERKGYENFRVAVSVRYAGDDAVLGLSETDAKLITVDVSHRTQSAGWKFSAYRANY